MKKFTLIALIALIGATSIFAQAPKSFRYQAVVRDNSGDVIVDQSVSFRVSIIQDSINGTVIYSETHNTTTNPFGMAVLKIGDGTVEFGDFENINWGTTAHFLKLELDETGNTNYQFMGISELLSVPYSINSSSLTLISPNGTNYEVIVDDNGNLNTNCFPLPSIADAGPDQINVLSPVILAANVPVSGTGTWTIVSGIGGNISDPNNPGSSFSGIPNNLYTLRWTIHTQCSSNYDEVNISFITSGGNGVPCPGTPTVTDIDGNIYNTVLIGTQCWMAENLNVGIMIDGMVDATNNGITEKSCYDDIEDNCNTYGGLYQWEEVMNYVNIEGTQGICPEGWHIPSENDWDELFTYLGGENIAGGKLKETEYEHWNFPNTDATNEFGFAAIGGGNRYVQGGFAPNLKESGYLWSSRLGTDQTAWYPTFTYNSGLADWTEGYKLYGINVRCIKDATK